MAVASANPSLPRCGPSPGSWEDLLSLSDEQLGRLDIAQVNLICARGLPGADQIDQALCLRTLDQMAGRVSQLTNFAVFQQRSERWDHSASIFRIHALISVLQREFGVRYNPAKIPVDTPLDLHDSFIHGILQGKGGTCGSLPVLYVAVGRRLGYPLKLVAARGPAYGHLFVRWDESPGERFNIEVSNRGFDCPPDNHYRTGLFKTRNDWERSGSILKSMTPREELAVFLSQRAACWGDVGQTRREVEALAWASALAPHDFFHREFLKKAMNQWHDGLQAQTPPGYPDVYIHWPPRRFPTTLPEEFERDILGLTVTEFLLRDPINDQKWWEPMRHGASPPLPRIDVRCTARGYEVQTYCC